MKMRLLSVCLACLVTVSASATDTPQLPAWLAGCWEQRMKNRLYEEQWMQPAANTMLGMSRMIVDGMLADSEFLQMAFDVQTNTLLYIALPSGQARTAFAWVGGEGEQLIFENLEHDFPQRIVYSRRGDELHARIEGANEGQWRGIDFFMNRVQCAAGRD